MDPNQLKKDAALKGLAKVAPVAKNLLRAVPRLWNKSPQVVRNAVKGGGAGASMGAGWHAYKDVINTADQIAQEEREGKHVSDLEAAGRYIANPIKGLFTADGVKYMAGPAFVGAGFGGPMWGTAMLPTLTKTTLASLGAPSYDLIKNIGVPAYDRFVGDAKEILRDARGTSKNVQEAAHDVKEIVPNANGIVNNAKEIGGRFLDGVIERVPSVLTPERRQWLSEMRGKAERTLSNAESISQKGKDMVDSGGNVNISLQGGYNAGQTKQTTSPAQNNKKLQPPTPPLDQNTLAKFGSFDSRGLKKEADAKLSAGKAILDLLKSVVKRSPAERWAWGTIGGLGNAGLWDTVNYLKSDDPRSWSEYVTDFNKHRVADLLVNGTVGAAGGALAGKLGVGATMSHNVLTTPQKDFYVSTKANITDKFGDIMKTTADNAKLQQEAAKLGVEAQRIANEGSRTTAEGMKSLATSLEKGLADSAKAQETMAGAISKTQDAITKATNAAASASKTNTMIMGGLGLTALAFGGYALYKYLHKPKEGARIKLNLPGKKGDPTTAATVDLPINMPEFSPALAEGLDRAVRLRTRKNIRANSLKRDPETGKLIPYDEWKDKYGDTPPNQLPSQQHQFRPSIPQGFQQALDKAASTRAVHERFGDLVSSALPATAGIVAGQAVADKFNIDPRIGRAAGGVIGGLAPTLLGRALATFSGPRTAEEQEEHDSGSPLLEYLIPGYAAYQSEKRVRADEDTKLRMLMQLANDQVLLRSAIPAIPAGTPCPPLPYDPGYEKTAGSRAGAEGAGSILTAVPSFHIGKMLTGLARENDMLPKSLVSSLGGSNTDLVGGALLGLLPYIAGTSLGNILPTRTKEEQDEHDAGTAALEYLIPGYGAYQAARRKKLENTEALTKKAPSEDMDSFDDFDDAELDKDASAGPPPPSANGPVPPPPSGAPAGGPPPAKPAEGANRPVDPGQNQVAAGLKKVKPVSADQIHGLVTNLRSNLGKAQEKPTLSATEKPQSVAAISAETMPRVNATLDRIRNLRYGNA